MVTPVAEWRDLMVEVAPRWYRGWLDTETQLTIGELEQVGVYTRGRDACEIVIDRRDPGPERPPWWPTMFGWRCSSHDVDLGGYGSPSAAFAAVDDHLAEQRPRRSSVPWVLAGAVAAFVAVRRWRR